MYLQKLINRRNNGEVKVITGSRRCGKSWLLSKIYTNWLISQGVDKENIILITFDTDDLEETRDLTDKDNLKAYLREKITSDSEEYYVFLDEIQEVDGFEKIVNGLNKKDNVDVYVTGSNQATSTPFSVAGATKCEFTRCRSRSFAAIGASQSMLFGKNTTLLAVCLDSCDTKPQSRKPPTSNDFGPKHISPMWWNAKRLKTDKHWKPWSTRSVPPLDR